MSVVGVGSYLSLVSQRSRVDSSFVLVSGFSTLLHKPLARLLLAAY
jgi:hypothetical protein